MITQEDRVSRTLEESAFIWDKTNGRCCYCGIPLNLFEGIEFTCEEDIENQMPCCKECNSQKGDKTLEGYRSYMISLTTKHKHFFYFEIKAYGPTSIGELLNKIFKAQI